MMQGETWKYSCLLYALKDPDGYEYYAEDLPEYLDEYERSSTSILANRALLTDLFLLHYLTCPVFRPNKLNPHSDILKDYIESDYFKRARMYTVRSYHLSVSVAVLVYRIIMGFEKRVPLSKVVEYTILLDQSYYLADAGKAEINYTPKDSCEIAKLLIDVDFAKKVISLGYKLAKSLEIHARLVPVPRGPITGYKRSLKIEEAVPWELASPLLYAKLVDGFTAFLHEDAGEGDYYILVDKSDSMETPFMKNIWARSVAVAACHLAVKRYAKVYLRFFDTSTTPPLCQPPIQGAKQAIVELLRQPVNGCTSIPVAILTALRDIEKGRTPNARCILVITDCEDSELISRMREIERKLAMLEAHLVVAFIKVIRNLIATKVAKAVQRSSRATLLVVQPTVEQGIQVLKVVEAH